MANEYIIFRCKCGAVTAATAAGMDPAGDLEFLGEHPGAEYVSGAPVLEGCRCGRKAMSPEEAIAAMADRIRELETDRDSARAELLRVSEELAKTLARLEKRGVLVDHFCVALSAIADGGENPVEIARKALREDPNHPGEAREPRHTGDGSKVVALADLITAMHAAFQTIIEEAEALQGKSPEPQNELATIIEQAEGGMEDADRAQAGTEVAP